jgi:hypothetical protein
VAFLIARTIVSVFRARLDEGAFARAPRELVNLRCPSRKCPPDAPYTDIVFDDPDALFEYQTILSVGFWKFGTVGTIELVGMEWTRINRPVFGFSRENRMFAQY